MFLLLILLVDPAADPSGWPIDEEVGIVPNGTSTVMFLSKSMREPDGKPGGIRNPPGLSDRRFAMEH
jgi:hypothetical protein